jgi:addiction module HigA family antidote
LYREGRKKKGELTGHWSIWVNGNWRVTFRFVETDRRASRLSDYHGAEGDQDDEDPDPPRRDPREDVLAELGLSVGEAAARLGLSRVTLSRVLHGHARVSANLAVRLEDAGVGTARAWLAMQSAHDIAGERATGVPEVRRLDTAA